MELRLDKQMPLERTLFLPNMTVQAMRDSRYRHPALALAELIDNSVDARASRVEILIREHQVQVSQRVRWRVEQLAVIDNGHGMSPETLVQALRFGGRQPSSSIKQIGKYGMGLPTSSVSQCKRVDVWSWTRDIEQSAHSYIDIWQIEEGLQQEVPAPDGEPIPREWFDMASSAVVNPHHGTLIVWSEPDRIVAQPQTIFNQVEEEIGRIYRWYIHREELSIRLASLRPGETKPQLDSEVHPNDPLYLMEDSTTPEPWNQQAMFTEYARREFQIHTMDREESVEVLYSIVKPEVLGNHRGDLPGNTLHGRHARKNMGISVIREDRELALENFFITEGGGGSVPENRWWGCEVRFGAGCDDAFGVDHNKQMVSYFARAVRDTSETDVSSRQQRLDDLGVGEDDIYAVVSHIRSTVTSMMREIERMFAQRPSRPRSTPKDVPKTIEEEAGALVRNATRDAIETGGARQTNTDLERERLDDNERKGQLADYLEHEGISPPEAEREAEKLVRNKDWFKVIHKQLDGYQMFSFEGRGGVLHMSLNIHHPIYEFLRVIEREAEESGSEVARRAAVGILAMLLSWGRMEDDIERADLRLQVQDRALHWGRMVSGVLRELNLSTSPPGE